MGDILYIELCERILVIILVITLSYYRYYYYFTLLRAELAIVFEILLQKVFELSKT